jgi:cytosine/adenosine deaminase-related metal-dependent hydrolase
VHVAEDRVDVEDARARGFESPLDRLLALEALPHGSILAHGVHLSSGQVVRAMDAGCWIVQNPRSNRANRVGYPAALGTASRVALGTDGFAADMMSERAALLDIGSAAGDSTAVLDARCVGSVRMTASLLGESMTDVPAENEAARWLERRATAARRQLEIDGRVVVTNGRLMSADLDEIQDEARRQARRLWTRLPAGSRDLA